MPHLDLAPLPVDRGDLGERVHVDVEAVAEQVGRRDEQRLLVLDDVPDVVRQAAVGERDVRPAIEHDDLALLAQAPRAGRARCAAGHTADDQYPVPALHRFSSASQLLRVPWNRLVPALLPHDLAVDLEPSLGDRLDPYRVARLHGSALALAGRRH